MACSVCGQASAPGLAHCEHCGAPLGGSFSTSESGGTLSDSDTEFGLCDIESQDPSKSFSSPHLQSFSSTGDLSYGIRFSDRYQIVEKIGEGGMGRVYKALDLALDRTIALKTIRTEKANNAIVIQRFKQELLLSRQITHRNVIRIFDFGEDAGTKFFTMEYIEGQSLREALDEKETLGVQETVDVMRQVLAGLEEAHRQGVIHRDLKPHNIMIDHQGVVRIMDFGIARTDGSDEKENGLTQSGQILGTPDYISPEQVKGRAVTRQADIFALGVILYELLTGKTPFRAENRLATILNRLENKPQPPRELNDAIPDYLQNIILKCMEVDPQLRYKTAADVLEDLNRQHVDGSVALRLWKFAARRSGWLTAAVLAGTVAVGAWYQSRPAPVAIANEDTVSIAVLPLHNVTGNEEIDWMGSGLSEMLITDLSQSDVIRPLTVEGIARVLTDLGKNDQSKFDIETLNVIGNITESDYTLSGKFIESQGELRLNLQLHERESGLQTAIQVDANVDDPFGAVDRLTEQIHTSLEIAMGDDRPIQEVTTASVGAFRAYHDGLAELRRGANQAAIPMFEQALKADSDFGMAHARLAEAYFRLGQVDVAKTYSDKSLHLLERATIPLSERYQIHAVAALIDNDAEAAVASYRRLVKLHPRDPNALFSLARSLEEHGKADEAVDVYRNTLERAPDFAAAILGLGRSLVRVGRNEDSVRVLDDAVERGQFKENEESLGMAHSILGVAYRNSSDYPHAIEELNKSLAYRRRIEDQRGVVATLGNLADALRHLGDFDAAEEHFEEALTMSRSIDSRRMESFALMGLGNVSNDRSDLDEALVHYRNSLEIEWERKNHAEIPIRLDAIAQVYFQQRLFADALVYLAQARVHLEESSTSMEQAFNLMMRGHVMAELAQLDEALEAYLAALTMFKESGDKRLAAETKLAISRVYATRGQFDAALATAEQSSDDYLSFGLEPESFAADLVRVNTYLVLGDIERAGDLVRRVEANLADLPLGIREDVLLARGSLFLAEGRLEDAQSHFEQVVALANPRSSPRVVARAKLGIARLTAYRGDFVAAHNLIQESLDATRTHRLRFVEIESTIVAAAIELRAKNTGASVRLSQAAKDQARAVDARVMFAAAHAVELRSLEEGNETAEPPDANAERICAAMYESAATWRANSRVKWDCQAIGSYASVDRPAMLVSQ